MRKYWIAALTVYALVQGFLYVRAFLERRSDGEPDRKIWEMMRATCAEEKYARSQTCVDARAASQITTMSRALDAMSICVIPCESFLMLATSSGGLGVLWFVLKTFN